MSGGGCVDVLVERILSLPPMAIWVLTVLLKGQSGDCKLHPSNCVMLFVACWAVEVMPPACAGNLSLLTGKDVLGYCISVAPDIRQEVDSRSIGGFQTWVPLLTNFEVNGWRHQPREYCHWEVSCVM